MEGYQNMRRHFRVIWGFAFILALASCHSSRKTTKDFEGMTFVTVRDFRNLDGCGFLLEQNDGKFLQPLNLDTTFQHEGMILGITFKTSKNPTICMKGTPIELLMVRAKP
jgi:hypothetical protein